MCKHCPTPDIEPFKPRVRVGIQFLDDNGPSDWRNLLAPGRIDLNDGTDCVLGQIFGDYLRGKDRLGICDRFAEAAGFAEPELDDDDSSDEDDPQAARTRALTAAWVAVLAESAEPVGASA
jgi:hypothetical protein